MTCFLFFFLPSSSPDRTWDTQYSLFGFRSGLTSDGSESGPQLCPLVLSFLFLTQYSLPVSRDRLRLFDYLIIRGHAVSLQVGIGYGP